MRIDGKAVGDLSNSPAADTGPSPWSPDQTWVAFTSDRTGNREIFITKPNTAETYNVTNFYGDDRVTDWR